MIEKVPAAEINETKLRQAAALLGPDSASARTIAELDRRRLAGEDVLIVATTSDGLIITPRDLFNGKAVKIERPD